MTSPITPPTFPATLTRLIVLDLETSNLDPASGGILQIGAYVLDPAREESFYRDVRHEHYMPWDAEAEKVHGVSREIASNHRRHSDTVALEDLLDWIEGTALGLHPGRAIIAGVSPRFDRDFLRGVAVKGDMVDRFNGLVSHRTFDLHTLAAAIYAITAEPAIEGLRNGLDGLYTDAIYNILGHAPEEKPHNALGGARRERLALLELIALLQDAFTGAF